MVRSSECLDEQFNSYVYIDTYIYIYIVVFFCLNKWWLECLQMFYWNALYFVFRKGVYINSSSWEPLPISKYQQQFSTRTTSNSHISKEILVETGRWDMSYCSCHSKMTWSTWLRWDLGVLFVFYIQGLTQMYLTKECKLLRTLDPRSFFSLHITRAPCLL
jgi:hypothetical protein